MLDSESLSSENRIQAKCRKKKSIRRIKRQYFLLVAGVFLLCGPYVATLTLQSSIAIEENIGTLAMGIAYLVSILITLFVSPFAMLRFGIRNVLLFGECGYLLYVAANFYPKKWVKIFAGIIVGAGEALLWPAISLYLWNFGYSQGLVATKPYGVYVRKYTGVMFAFVQAGQVLASGIAYGILHGAKSRNQSMEVGFAPENLTTDTSMESLDQYQYCGANDCLDQNVTEENIDRYVPANQTSLYVLIGVFCCSCILGLGLQACKLEKPKTRRDPSKDEGLLSQDGEKGQMSDHTEKVQMHYLSTLGETLKQLTNLQQLLLIPITFYVGLLFTFVTSEVTRSFVSCVIGVERVGMALMLYSAVSGVMSIIIPKAVEKIGRIRYIVLVWVLDVSNYTFCLFWRPDTDTEFVVYILCLFFGISDATWKNLAFDCHTAYFKKDLEIHYTLFNTVVTMGLSVAFLWTPLFCVRTKLLIQIAAVSTAVICCGLAERRHRRIIKKEETESPIPENSSSYHH